MKHLLSLVILLSLSSLCLSQELDLKTNHRGKDEIKEVVSSGLDENQLFYNAQNMMAIVYSSFTKLLDNENSKTIVAKGIYDLGKIARDMYDEGYSKRAFIEFHLKIECKDKRYRYTITNINFYEFGTEYKRVNDGNLYIWYMSGGMDYAINQMSLAVYGAKRKSKVTYTNIKFSEIEDRYLTDSINASDYMKMFNQIRQDVNNADSKKEKDRLYKEMSSIGKRSLELNDRFQDTKLFHAIGESCINHVIGTIKDEMNRVDEF